ncbi:MAG: DEAD/DEAH box helicase family protein, partial [Bacteroidaceae bacterium]
MNNTYKNNGKIYDIPSGREAEFERKYPLATVAYSSSDGKIYDIPVSKRGKFLDKYADAKPYNTDTDKNTDTDGKEAVEGFFKGMEIEGVRAKENIKTAVAEGVSSYITGSKRDYIKARETLSKLDNAGYDLDVNKFDDKKAIKDFKSNEYNEKMEEWRANKDMRKREREKLGWMDAIKHKLNDPAQPQSPFASDANAYYHHSVAEDAEYSRVFRAIKEALEESEGDINRAYTILESKSSKDTWGDKVAQDAQEEIANLPQTKGKAAWAGGLTTQMLGNAASIASSFFPATRWLAKPLAAANIAALTTSSAGSSMSDARLAGASDKDVHNAGYIAMANESITEALPAGRYLANIQRKVAKKLTKDVAEKAIASPAAKNELEHLLAKAAKELPRKLINGKNAKEYAKSIITEGGSEAAAGFIETFIPMIYEDEENYPTLKDALKNGWEGAKGGAFMGGILGAGSTVAGHYANRNRRKKQGNIMLADTENGVVEIVGEKDDDTMFALDGNGMPLEIKTSMIIDSDIVGFEEFDNYCKNQTKENLDIARESGRELVNGDAQAKREAKEDYERELGKFYKEKQDELEAVDNPLDYIVEHYEQAEVIIPFFNAKSKLDGMIDGIADDIDSQVSRKLKEIDEITHESGNIYTVKMFGNEEQQANLVRGDITVGEDGAIDLSNSSNFVFVKQNGEIKMVSPREIVSIDNVVNANEYKIFSEEKLRDYLVNNAKQEIEPDTDTDTEPDTEQYNISDEINVNGVNGIISQKNAEGKYIVQFEDKIEIDGVQQRAFELSAEEITNLTTTNNNNGPVVQEVIPEPLQEDVQQQQEEPLQEDVQQLEDKQLEAIPLTKSGKVDYKLLLDNNPELFAKKWEERPGVGEDGTIQYLNNYSKKLGEEIEKKKNKIDNVLDPNILSSIEDDILDLLTRKKKIETLLATRYSPARESQQEIKKSGLSKYQEDVNSLISSVRAHNAQTPGRKLKANVTGINRRANNLGFVIRQNRGDITVFDQDGKEIKRLFGRRQSRAEIESHKKLDDYDDIIISAVKDVYAAPNAILNSNAWTSGRDVFIQGLNDAINGVKSAAANDVLDTIDSAYKNGLTYGDGELVQETYSTLREAVKFDNESVYNEFDDIEKIDDIQVVTNNNSVDLELENDIATEEVDNITDLEDMPEWILDGYNSEEEFKQSQEILNLERKELNLQNKTESNVRTSINTTPEGYSETLPPPEGVRVQESKDTNTERNDERRRDEEVSSKIAQEAEVDGNRYQFAKTNVRSEPITETTEALFSAENKSDSALTNVDLPQKIDKKDVSIFETAENVLKNEKVNKAEKQVNQNQTDGQKKAGNYKKGHVKLLGYDITIENPKGSERSGVDSDGTPWSITMNNTYGYFKGTKGKDGDHIDTFLGENLNSEKVFVVDQLNSDKSFDEHKVMLGFDSIEEAKEAYLSNYEENWQGLGNITETTLDNFKKWTDVKTRKQKPFADYTMNSSNDASNVYGIGNKIVSTDRYAELKKKLRSKLGQLNAGFDPEIFAIGAEMAAYHIEAGTRKFADFSKRMYSDMGEAVVPYLKSFYQGAQAFPGMEDFAKETDNSEIINNFDYKLLSNVHNTTGDSKRDSGDVSVEQQSNARPILSQRREGGRNRNGATGDSSKSIGRDSSEGDSSLYATIFGEPGDNRVHRADQAVQSPGDDAGDTIGTGGSVDGTTGLHDDAAANGANDTDATRVPGSFAERSKLKLELQHKAESITNTSICDLTNIEETLPFLLPEQHGDVLKAENRFFSDSQKTKELANGKGMLFTNGTGTGKTYTGLGIIKRFVKQNVKDILIVVPTQPKVTDWIKDGKNLLLDISPLEDTSSSGEGINITTYANLRSNQELMKREFGLVVYDESHRLMEDKNGGQSSTTLAHYKITNKDRNNALQRLQSFHPLWTESKGLLDKLDAYSKEYNSDEISGERGATIKNEKKTIDTRLIELRSLQEEVLPELEAQADKAVEKTKTVFLSATPFKSHFNLRYANGYLFDWGNEESYQGHSRVDAESRFFLDNFGSAYEWKYHRMQQKSKANSDAIALQEVQFAERLMTSGVMSGRTINSDKDYSREFPRVNGLNTDMFNKAFSDIFNYTENKYSWLREGAKDVFYNYNYSTQLFEALKTSMSIPRMQKHLELGRKVVVFHRRKQSNVMPPFNSILSATRNKAKALLANEYVSPEQKEQADAILSQADTFEASNKELLEYEQTLNYSSAIAQIQEAFGDRAVYINGDVSKNNKDKAIKQFNADDSSIDLIVIQEESGKEGISLHDTSGKHQRVLMNMSMPVSSITALQIEGRIYRIGQETDAIFEYPLLGLDMEIEYFGRNINKRLSTTENLAVGEQSRDLIRSFADGVISESEFEDPHVAQGKGGKEMDRKMQSELSEYRKAVLVYHSNQKNRFKRSQREGNDYYATPEPIGQKMVEWLNLKKDDSVMEPSAGHGAIAMWFPNWVNSTAIEPSFSLYSKLNAKAGGGDRKILNTTFEEFNIINKFNGIAMNPPFGSGGATAISHIEKAFHHLKNGGRLVAIVPNGGSMQKRLDKFLFGENDKGKRNNPDAVLVQEVILPGVTFEQAGTNVNCKVVIIDKIPVEQQQSSYSAQIDLSYAKNVGELFDKLEVIYVPARQQLAAGAQNVVETDFITKIKI